MSVHAELSVVIPSYQRGYIALESIAALLRLQPPPAEILLVDQTTDHPSVVAADLRALHEAGRIRWLRLTTPSIPHAMNQGLLEAKSDFVLFLDDDIVPDQNLVCAHLRAHSQGDSFLVAGMVLQPGERPVQLVPGEQHRFNSDSPALVAEFIGCNFSVRRAVAIALGGFDENFVGAAYRYEAEFARRYVERYGLFLFDPRARIRHLAIPTGGTRAHGHHLRTMQPTHAVGAFYFLLCSRHPGWWWQVLWRPIRAVRTRHHLRRPWWIPLTLFAECRGFCLAYRLHRRGPRLLNPSCAMKQCEEGHVPR